MTSPAPVEGCDGVVCDVDGVLRRGQEAVPGAAQVLTRLRAAGVPVVLATNNASHDPRDLAAGLADIGVDVPPESVVTSAMAGAAVVAQLVGPAAEVVALGGAGVAVALRERGLVPVAPTAAAAAAVLQGYGPDLRVRDFAAAARLVASGVPWVATNEDRTLPLEWGQAPGNGAYVRLLADVTGATPVATAGKPHLPLYELALERLGCQARSALAVGDRLDTDIDGARTAGMRSAWVLTGVHRPSDLVAAPDRAVPDHVLDTVSGLLEPYDAPRREGEWWVCAGHRARVAAPTAGEILLDLEGEGGQASDGAREAVPGPPVTAVRAGLAALLAARERPGADTAALARAARALDGPGR